MFLSGDGSIDFLEFLEVMANKMGEHTFEDDLRDAFQLFDTDCNGYISKRELTFVLTSLGEQITDAAVENMIKEVDLDGDGRVNYEGNTLGYRCITPDKKKDWIRVMSLLSWPYGRPLKFSNIIKLNQNRHRQCQRYQ